MVPVRLQKPIAGSMTGFCTSESRRTPTQPILRVANGRIDRLIIGDVEAADPLELGLTRDHPSVDCLAFGDVLEHLVDPWAVLFDLAQFVREGGQILACIPNVQHY